MQNDKSTMFPRLRLCHTKGFSKLLSTCYHLKRVPAKPNTCSHEGKRCKVKAKKNFLETQNTALPEMQHEGLLCYHLEACHTFRGMNKVK